MVVYRQPDDKYNGHPSSNIDFNIPLKRAKNAILSLNPTPDIIVGGDFNLPHASWPEGIPTDGATVSERSMLNAINDFSNDLFLCQYVRNPTHKDGNILDLVFVNNPILVNSCLSIPVLQSTSHHSIVEVSTTYLVKNTDSENQTQQAPKTMFNTLNFFSEDINWEELNGELEKTNWNDLFNDCNTDNMLEVFYNTTIRLCEKYIPPCKKVNVLKNSKATRYRNSLTKRRRKLKKRLLNTISETRSHKINCELLEIEKKLQKSFRDSLAFMEDKAIKAISSNSKYFYSYVKKKSKVKTKIGPLLDELGKLTGDSKEMAEILSRQYTKVFSEPKDDYQQYQNKHNLRF